VHLQGRTPPLRIIDKIVSAVGRRVDESNPYVDARLKDGSRFNAMVPPVAVDGSLVSIRKFKKEKLGIDDLVGFGAFTEEMAAYLQARSPPASTSSSRAVPVRVRRPRSTRCRPSSTTTNASSPSRTRRNSSFSRPMWAGWKAARPTSKAKGAVTQRDCLRNALRMRPDRIIVGETRGEEVIDMLQAMNTGHDGSMTTIHANSARDACSRLENMIAMAGIEMPIKAVRAQIASAVNLIVQASRLQDGSRRMVSITEVTGMEGEVISMQEVFRFQRTGLRPDNKIIGHFTATGVRSHYAERFRQWGYDLPRPSIEPVRRGVSRHGTLDRTAHLHRHLRRRPPACRRHLSDGVRQVDQPQRRVNRRLAMLEKGAGREDVLEQLRKEMAQHMGRVRDPALLAIADKAQKANIAFSPEQLILVMIGLTVVAFLALTVLTTAALPIRALVSVVMGVGGVYHLGGNSKAKKRIAMIEEQLPDAVELMVRSLRVGHPFVSAVHIVAREVPDPLASELGVIADEAAYGRDVSEAIKGDGRTARHAGSCASSRWPSASSRPRAATSPRSCTVWPR
jgi:hypothetical protein